MAAKISLTPDTLLSQGNQMESLAGEFDSLFSNVTKTLNDTNNNWSENLAHNFSGKITSAQKSFSVITELLTSGAEAAKNSATTFSSVDSSLVNAISGNEATAALFAGSQALSSTADMSNEAASDGITSIGPDGREYTLRFKKTGSDDDPVEKAIKKREELREKAVVGISKALKKAGKKVKKVIKDAQKSYENKGAVYKAVQFGKAALKIGVAAVKIAGAVATIPTGVGIPIALCSIISAGNDIYNATSDMTYLFTGDYDLIGQTNMLKDTLVSNSQQIFKDEQIGEVVGKVIYYGLDAVALMNGIDKLGKNFGKLEKATTGSYGYSYVWGSTETPEGAIDIPVPKITKTSIVKKVLHVTADTPGDAIIDIIDGVKSVVEKGKKYSNEMGDLYVNYASK